MQRINAQLTIGEREIKEILKVYSNVHKLEHEEIKALCVVMQLLENNTEPDGSDVESVKISGGIEDPLFIEAVTKEDIERTDPGIIYSTDTPGFVRAFRESNPNDYDKLLEAVFGVDKLSRPLSVGEINELAEGFRVVVENITSRNSERSNHV